MAAARKFFHPIIDPTAKIAKRVKVRNSRKTTVATLKITP
jgi:hypothetical protein